MVLVLYCESAFSDISVKLSPYIFPLEYNGTPPSFERWVRGHCSLAYHDQSQVGKLCWITVKTYIKPITNQQNVNTKMIMY